MPRGKKFSAEQIIAKLREAEIELARGKKIPEVCKKIGVTGLLGASVKTLTQRR